jgi:Putative zinc-finger
MKCDDCLNLLAEYIDGETIERDAEQISAHLITCADCASEFEVLTAEQEVFARYDRELNISPSTWQAIEARTATGRFQAAAISRRGVLEWFTGLFAVQRFGYAFGGALAVSIIAAVFGLMYLRTHQQAPKQETLIRIGKPGVAPGNDTVKVPGPVTSPLVGEEIIAAQNQGLASRRKSPKQIAGQRKKDDPGVLFADVAYSDLEERDTAEHIRQAENLLRSIRSLQAADDDSADDSEIDVSYEKAMSRRLLSENAVLLSDAEAAGKFPTKELLRDLEPFLIDIANLPDKSTATQLRAIKDRVQKTEIVAALVSY